MNLQINPNRNQFISPEGYKDLGWQLTFDRSEEFKKCVEAKHERKEFDNSYYLHRGTDVIIICDTCKHFWHTDMSD